MADIDSAVELATKWSKEGKMDYFRGQAYPWPPRSSLMRSQDCSNGEILATNRTDLDRYWDWLEQHNTLSNLLDDPEHALAVAQHFGIPTDLVDFTKSPERGRCDLTPTFRPL